MSDIQKLRTDKIGDIQTFLEFEIGAYTDYTKIEILKNHCEWLISRIAELEDALGFYANKDNYNNGTPGNCVGAPDGDDWEDDNGQIARRVLGGESGGAMSESKEELLQRLKRETESISALSTAHRLMTAINRIAELEGRLQSIKAIEKLSRPNVPSAGCPDADSVKIKNLARDIYVSGYNDALEKCQYIALEGESDGR